jgi:ribosomal protein S18 acetylase RimI-like enzyme
MNEGNFYLKKIQAQKKEEKQLDVFEPEKREYLKVETEMVVPEKVKKYVDIWLDAAKNTPNAFRSNKKAKTLYEDESKRTEQEWIDKISNPDEQFFVLANNPDNKDEAISMAGAVKGEKWRIVNVYTKKDFSGRGVGRQVVEKVLEKLRNKGVKEVYLYVKKAPEQENAFELYKKLGFKDLGLVSAYKKHKSALTQIDWHTMELDLTKEKK